MKKGKLVPCGTKRKYVGLAVLFLALLVPMVYVNSAAGYLGAVFFLLAVLLSVLCLLPLSGSVTARAGISGSLCARGEKRKLLVEISNASRVIAPAASASLYMKDIFGKVIARKELTFSVGAENAVRFGYGVRLNHIGVYQVGVGNIRIRDMLGLLELRLPAEKEYDITVVPRTYDVSRHTGLAEAEALERDTGVAAIGGMDYVGVREYARGDSMKQIHWKLSARQGNYMTKLTESARMSSYVILLDQTSPEYRREDLLDINDCLIETALSIADFLSGRDVVYSMMYRDRDGNIQRLVPTAEGYGELTRSLDRIRLWNEEKHRGASRLLEEEQTMGIQSSNLFLCTAHIGGELVQQLIQIRRQRRIPELFFAIPKGLNSREREQAMRPLLALDDAGIAFHVIRMKDGVPGFLNRDGEEML